jgi:nucleoid-associated protein YgaU
MMKEGVVALNLKLALGVCLVFIASMTWLLDATARPATALPWPTGASAMAAAPPPLLTPGEASPPRFAEPSAAEREFAQNATAPVAPSVPPPAPVTLVLPTRVEFAPSRSALLEEEPVGVAVVSPAPVPPASVPPAEPPVIAANPTDSSALTLMVMMPDTSPPAPDATPAAVGEVAPAQPAQRYTVQRGDTLSKIARRTWPKAARPEGELVAALLTANPHLKGQAQRIKAGEDLVIPDLTAASAEARSAPSVGSLPGGVAIAPTAAVEAAATAGTSWYTIRERDSLRGIARRLLQDERRWSEIMQLNGLRDGARIQPGMRIKLPPALAAANG